MNSPVIFITGSSKGIGLATVVEALAQGYNVAAISRNKQQLLEAVKAAGASTENFLPNATTAVLR